MTDYLIITGANCPYCDTAKATITERGQTYTELNMMEDPMTAHTISTLLGFKTVPLILKVVGGSDKL